MPEISQLFFSHKELLEMLVKKADIHEGKWQLVVNFGFTAGNFGPNDTEMSPGAATIVNAIGIQKAVPESPPALVIDAAAVNPAST
jgi:hypothetical protein